MGVIIAHGVKLLGLLVLAASLQPSMRLRRPSVTLCAVEEASRRSDAGRSRRELLGAGVGAIATLAAPRPSFADGYGGNTTEFDAAAYFGIFSCEGWGQKRMPGSNSCMPK